MIKQFLIDFFIRDTLADVMGYTALFCGGAIMLSPMLNRSIMRPLGIFAFVGVIVASVLGTNIV